MDNVGDAVVKGARPRRRSVPRARPAEHASDLDIWLLHALAVVLCLIGAASYAR